MFVKKVNFVIYLALALVVGFGASFLFGKQSVQSDLVSGDISKASLYSNQKADPETTVIEEKLKNDEAFLNTTKLSMALLKERVEMLDELTGNTVKACADVPEFKEVMKSIESLQAKTFNTNLAIDAAAKGLEKLVEGQSAPEYEVASNNTFIGFNKIENQLSVGKEFVKTAEAYLEGKEGKKAEQIAAVASEWVRYCVQDAALNNSDENLAYWQNTVQQNVANTTALCDKQGEGMFLSNFSDMNFPLIIGLPIPTSLEISIIKAAFDVDNSSSISAICALAGALKSTTDGATNALQAVNEVDGRILSNMDEIETSVRNSQTGATNSLQAVNEVDGKLMINLNDLQTRLNSVSGGAMELLKNINLESVQNLANNMTTQSVLTNAISQAAPAIGNTFIITKITNSVNDMTNSLEATPRQIIEIKDIE